MLFFHQLTRNLQRLFAAILLTAILLGLGGAVVVFAGHINPGPDEQAEPAAESADLPAQFLPPSLSATKSDALQVDNDGDGEADPGDLLRYTVVISNTGADPATGVIFTDTIDANTTLSGTAHVSPIALDDSYSSLGNVGISVPAGSGLLSNDVDPDNNSGTLTVASADSSSANGGEVSVSADGSFTYTPTAGFEGPDTFAYTISDGDPLTPDGPGTVTITVNEVIWFVDNTAAGGGDGRLGTPYNSLAAFVSGAADETSDIIFLYSGSGNYTGGVTLLNSQFLIGQGATASIVAITGITVPPHSNPLPATGGASPTITNAGGSGVALASGNTLRGFNVGAASGFGISGSSVALLTVSEVAVNNTTAGGVSLNGSGAMNAVFTSISSSGGTNGISLINTAGTFTATAGTLSGSSGTAFNVSGGTAVISYTGSITKTSAGSLAAVSSISGGSVTLSGNLTCNTSCTGISVGSNSGGTITFSGGSKVLNTGGNTAVNLTNNTGATINFTNGGLDIDTTSGAGFTATGGGTVNVLGSGNDVDTTTGTGVNIANTTIGSSGVTFESVSVNGATNGIVLNNTGSSGFFTVSGDGSTTGGVLDRDGSGGTIISTIGILLTNAHNITLRQMNLNNNGDHAIQGIGGSDHVLSAVTIQNPTNHGWEATDLQGVNRIDNGSLVTQFNGINQDGVRLINTNTNFTSFTVDNVTFSNSSTGNDGFFHRALGATSGAIIVTNSTFTGLDADGVQVANDGSGAIVTTIQGNTFTTADTTNGDGNNGLALNLGGTGVHQFMVGGPNPQDGNTFFDVNRLGDNSGIINVTAAGAGTGATSQINGTIQGNDISNSTGRRGISVLFEASGGTGHGGHTIVIDDNDINDIAREGIYIGMSTVLGRSNTGNSITITDNNVGDVLVVSTAGNREGIEVEAFHDGDGGGSIEADVLVQNNVVETNNTDETFRVTNDAFTTAGAASTTLDVTVLGNSFTNNNSSGDSFEFRNWDPGSTSCLDINANNVAGDRNDANLGYLIARSGGTFGIEGLAAGSYTNAQVNTFVDARNDGGGSNASGDSFSGGVTCNSPVATGVPISSVVNFPNNATEPNFTLLVNWNTEKDRNINLRQNEDTTVAHVMPGRFVISKLADVVNRASVSNIEQATILSGENINIPVGTLPAGKSVTVIFEAVVDNTIPANDTEVCNQATIQSNELPDVLSDDPDTGAANDPTCTAVPQADLSLAKTDDPDPVLAGGTLLYTVTVTNNGPSTAQNVVVTDTLPAGVTFVSTAGCANDPNGVPACSLGDIPASTSAQFTVQVTVDSGTTGVITNTAVAAATTHDPVSGNNAAGEGTTVLPPAAISIVKDADPADGTDFDFTSDLGPFTLDDAVPDDIDGITDTVSFDALYPGSYTFIETAPLPGGFMLTGLSCDSGSWSADLGNQAVTINLAAGEDVTCTFTNATNQPPVLSNVAVTSPINENEAATLTGDIADPDTGDTFQLVVDWGDGAVMTYSYPAGTTAFTETHLYLDDNPSGTPSDNYVINLTLFDSGGGSDTGGATVTVNNVAPALGSLSAVNVNENGSTTLTGAIADVGSQDTFTLTVDWGDGTPPDQYTYPAGTTAFNESHQYLDDDPSGTAADNYTISLTLEDDDGGSDSDSAQLTVSNVAPAVTNPAVTPLVISETNTISLTGVISDPGTLDTFTMTVDWMDGSVETFTYLAGTTSFLETHTYDDGFLPPSTASLTDFAIALTLEDDDLGVSPTEMVTVTVNNVAPTLSSITATSPITENGSITLTGNIGEISPLDTFTLTVDWGDGTPPDQFFYPAGTAAFTETYQYLDDNPSGTPVDVYTLTLVLEDDDGGVDIAAANVTVANDPPLLLNPAVTPTVSEDDFVTLTGLISDIGSQDTFTLTVDWGDGSPLDQFAYAAGTTAFTESHQYIDDNPSGTPSDTYTISLTLEDDDTGMAGGVVTTTVNNLPPAVDAGADVSLTLGAPVTFSGVFSDAGTLDTHTILWDFGDGMTATGTLSPSHTYLAPGVYTVTLTVTDDDGGTGSDTLLATVKQPTAVSLSSFGGSGGGRATGLAAGSAILVAVLLLAGVYSRRRKSRIEKYR